VLCRRVLVLSCRACAGRRCAVVLCRSCAVDRCGLCCATLRVCHGPGAVCIVPSWCHCWCRPPLCRSCARFIVPVCAASSRAHRQGTRLHRALAETADRVIGGGPSVSVCAEMHTVPAICCACVNGLVAAPAGANVHLWAGPARLLKLREGGRRLQPALRNRHVRNTGPSRCDAHTIMDTCLEQSLRVIYDCVVTLA